MCVCLCVCVCVQCSSSSNSSKRDALIEMRWIHPELLGLIVAEEGWSFGRVRCCERLQGFVFVSVTEGCDIFLVMFEVLRLLLPSGHQDVQLLGAPTVKQGGGAVD